MPLMKLAGIVATIILAVLAAYYFSRPHPRFDTPPLVFNDARWCVGWCPLSTQSRHSSHAPLPALLAPRRRAATADV